MQSHLVSICEKGLKNKIESKSGSCVIKTAKLLLLLSHSSKDNSPHHLYVNSERQLFK